MRRKVLRKISFLLSICLLLAACGREPGPNGTAATGAETAGTEQTSTPEPQTDWQEKRLPTAGAVKDALLYVNDNISVEYREPGETVAHTCLQLAWGNDFYVLDSYRQQDTVSASLQKINGDTGAGEQVSLSTGVWEIEGGLIQGMDVVNDDRLVFWVSGRSAQDDQEIRSYAVYTDCRGQIQNKVELTDILRENGIREGLAYAVLFLGSDSQGNVYIDDVDGQTVYMLDAEGKLAGSYAYPSDNGAGSQSFRTSDGKRILVCGVPGEWEWVQLDPDTGEANRHSLQGIKNVQRWYAMWGNLLYYAADHQLVSWDTDTGERKLLARLDEVAGYADALEMAVMPAGNGLRLLLTKTDEARRYILTLSQDRPAAEGEIQVANLYGESSFFSERVLSFGRENPSFGIQYQAAFQEAEADRVLLEVANGGGPDLLYLPRQNVKALQANGALGELGRLLSQDTLDVLLPGAVQAGTYEGGLYAVPLSVYVRTLLTARAYWQEDGWTTRDILSLLAEQDDIEGLFVDITGQDEYAYNLYFLMGMDIPNSPFIKDGVSSFDCTEFREILKTVKDMTQKAENNSTLYDRTAPLVSGGYLGVECMVWDMKIFSETCEKLGDNANLVGYPSDAGGSHFLVDKGMLVVNQNAMEKEGVKELVNYLLSLESQQLLSQSISVRADIPSAQVAYNEAGKTYYWKSANNTGYQLPAKADGTSYLEEYVELLEKAVPMAFDSEEVFNLVMEDADSYFHSDKDLDTVVDAIQKRVQIYLDERQ